MCLVRLNVTRTERGIGRSERGSVACMPPAVEMGLGRFERIDIAV